MNTTGTSLKKLVLKALFIALVTVSTMIIQIPVPMTEGYIHFGDSMIFLIAVFFGRRNGAIAGGIGSMFADIFSGYGHWAPFTFVIKGLMGFVVGYCSKYESKKQKFFSVGTILGVLAGFVVMVGGYLIGGTILKGSFAVALTSVPSNCMQGLMGVVLFFIVGKALDKIQITKYTL